jgi:ABC-2 type transport system ATP-binding protein
MFETIWSTISFSRGLFGRAPTRPLEKVLRDLSLWDKRHDKIMTLSGGMKRRVLIAKALAHEPRSCSSTNRRRASTSSCAATCGRWCAAAR